MGSCQSKNAKPPRPPPNRAQSFDDQLNESLHGKHRTTRQKMARHNEDTHITDAYNIVSILGQGSMGEVTLVEKKVDSSLKAKAAGTYENTGVLNSRLGSQPYSKARQYACKTVNTLRMNKSELMEFINEIEILRDLDHPNIVQLFEVFHQKRKIWIVTELCLGGDLWTRANENTEEDVVNILNQITRAVTYMHKRNVCHRDIKMENILYSDTTPTASVKLIDFGISNKFTRGVKMLNACGTVYTAAPETLLKTGSTHSTDIWSIGVVAFILLSQEYPFLKDFDDMKDQSKVQKLEKAEFSFGAQWQHRNTSSVAKRFVELCLKKDCIERCSASEALNFVQTEWSPHLESLQSGDRVDEVENSDVSNEVHQTQSDPSNFHDSGQKCSADLNESNQFSPKKSQIKMSPCMLDGMTKFGQYGELKKTILMTMSYAMDKSSLRELSELFISLDTSQNGTITLIDLKTALERMDSEKHLDDKTIEELFRGVDVDSSGQIHYHEFLAAIVESQGLITMEHLAEAFDRIDKDGKGYISKSDLKEFLGKECNEDIVNKMVEEADFKNNGQVDYDEFLRLMFSDPASGYENLGSDNFVQNDAMISRLHLVDSKMQTQDAGKNT